MFFTASLKKSLSSLILLVVYILGMRVVYMKRPAEDVDSQEIEDTEVTLKKAWTMFSIVSAGVDVAGFFLAASGAVA